MRQTHFAKQSDPIRRQWRHVDAEGQRLGRMAVEVATVLMGKHRPDYTPHVDLGDYVVVTNAEKVVLTGNKAEQKIKTSFSKYCGGLKAETYASLIRRRPESVIENAVRRMLPKSRLGRQMLRKLKVYRGAQHPHAAQRLTPLEV